MRAVIQRVHHARVSSGDEVVGEIGKGLLVFLGVHHEDTNDDADVIMRRVLGLKLWTADPDDTKRWTQNIRDIEGEILCVSNFTLYGDIRKKNKPDFRHAMQPDDAIAHYESFLRNLKKNYAEDKIQSKYV
eukprot:Clim_evm10s23 gene=Clim_evmTU10s23